MHRNGPIDEEPSTSALMTTGLARSTCLIEAKSDV
jgi:hypothetical protein